jgi:hypothetical protein
MLGHKKHKNNSSGVTGVHYHRDGGYVAKIKTGGHQIYLGFFYELADAAAARHSAETALAHLI